VTEPAVLTLLTREDCSLCEHAKDVVRRVQHDQPLTLEEVHLDSERCRALAEEHDVLVAPGSCSTVRPSVTAGCLSASSGAPCAEW
jgi:hypothetical protein